MVLLLVAAGAAALWSGWGSRAMGTPFPDDFDQSQVVSDYTISNAQELQSLAAASKSFDFAGVTIHLAADIDYTGQDSFQGIGNSTYPFCGTFDGEGHTIKGLYSTSSGLFLVIGSTDSPVVIRDLTLEGAQISGGEGRAVLVCRFSGAPQDTSKNGLIQNVSVIGSTGSFTGSNCGILVGRCQEDGQSITIDGCRVTDCQLVCTAASETNVARWGMVLGKDVSAGYSKISACTVTESTIGSENCNIDQAGLVLGGSFNAITIEGCQVMACGITTGLVSDTVTQELGGIAGCLKSSVGVVSDCHVASTTITTKGLSRYVGLLIGHPYGGTISDCTVKQSRIDSSYVDGLTQAEGLGGLIGYLSGSKATIQRCAVSRTTLQMADRAVYVGGLVGQVADTSAGTVLKDSHVSNSYLRADFTSTDTSSPYLGGVIGGALGQVTAQGVDAINVQITAASPLQGVGGWAGMLGGSSASDLKECEVFLSTIASTAAGTNTQVGGMVGQVVTAPARLWQCVVRESQLTFQGLVDSVGGMIGGIEAAGCVLTDSTVSQVTMDSSFSANTQYSRLIGGVLGSSSEKIHATDVRVEDLTIGLASLVQGMGGFAGYLSGTAPSVLTRCSVEGLQVTETQSPLDDTYMSYHISTFLGCVDSQTTLASCTVSDSHILLQGRMLYLGGLVASTYSDVLKTEPLHGTLTAENCSVTDSSLTTKQSRNCNESGGLVGWLSEGGRVTDCFVSGVTTPSNTNSGHVGGLIGYIPESTTQDVSTTVENCFVKGCTLSGKNSLSATIGNAVASGEVFRNNYHYGCTLLGGTESDASGAEEVTSGLTDGTLLAGLNGNSSWIQGTESPELDPGKVPYSSVKVMTYNIYYLTQNDSYPIADRQSKVIDLIDSCISDGVGVIGLQEVTKIWYDYIKNYVNQQNTDFVWCGYGRYGGTFGGFASGANDNGDAFSLILYDTSRYSKVEEGHFWLSDTPEEKSLFYTVASNYRVVNWVRLRDKTTGEEFVFLNAHFEQTQSTPITNSWGYTLDADSGVTARILQAQLVCDQMEAHAGGVPVIMVGDWNSYAGTDGYSTILAAGYQDLREIATDAEHCGAYNAWSRTDPARFAKGDHIVASEGCTGVSCQVLDTEDVDATTGYHISDHCPMVAEIRY